MPWKETCAMDERLKFVAEHLQDFMTLSDLCRKYGISRPTAYKWIERYASFGPEGLLERPRAPKCHPNQTPAVIEEKIVAFRHRHEKWGPRKLLNRLEKREPQIAWPAVSTAGTILKRHGLIVPRRRRQTPEYTGPWHEGISPNDVWAADFKGWFKTGDGNRIDPLTITDWSSRYLLCCQALGSAKGLPTKMQFERVFREYGLPWAIRSDNGVPFASVGLGGLSRLSVWWIHLGIWPERIRPGHPEENGRHARMHKTLKEATAKPPRQTSRAQQAAFERFQQEYNEERPHEALNMQTPGEWYRVSERKFPNHLPDMEYGPDFKVRNVRDDGYIRWNCETIYLNAALAGERVGLKQIAEDLWSIHFGPLPLATYHSWQKRLERWKPT
jgi:transposase InsO family protein